MNGRRRQRRAWLGPTITVLALMLALPAVAGGKAQAGGVECTPGVRSIRGFPARVFCGPAKATVIVNRKRITFRNGVCERHPDYFLVNVGTAVTGVGAKKSQLPYFGLIMGRSPAYDEPVVNKPGTYHKGLVTVNAGGTHVDLHDEADLMIVLGKGMRSGRFSATKPASPIDGTPAYKVSGTFSC